MSDTPRMKLDFVWVLIGIFAALWAWVWPWALIPIIGTSIAAILWSNK